MNNYKVSSPNIHTHGGWTPSSPSNCQFRAKREISPSHRPHGIAGGSGESDRVSSVDSVAKIRGGGTHGVEGGGLGSLLGRSKGGCGGQAGDEYGSRLHGSIVWVVVTRVENLCVGVWFGRRYTSISPASRGGEPPNLSNYLRISTARPPARLVVTSSSSSSQAHQSGGRALGRRPARRRRKSSRRGSVAWPGQYPPSRTTFDFRNVAEVPRESSTILRIRYSAKIQRKISVR